MASDTKEEQEAAKQMKAVLWYRIGMMVREQADLFDTEVTPQFIASLVEATWTQIETTGEDIEMFAKHAGRSTVNASDVLLLARRNEGLESLMRDYYNELEAEKQKRTSGKG